MQRFLIGTRAWIKREAYFKIDRGDIMVGNVSMRFGGKFAELSPIDRMYIRHMVLRRVYNSRVLDGDVAVNLVHHTQKFRRIPLFSTTVRLYNHMGRFVARGHEYGIGQSLNEALKKIEGQVIKQKTKRIRTKL